MSDNKKFEASGTAGRAIAIYEYQDELGNVLFYKRRYVPKSFRFERNVNGVAVGGRGCLDGCRIVPYRLPAWKDASTVLLCEGEKDADNIAALRFNTTTAPFGAGDGKEGKWPAELTPCFKDKTVYICYDHDESGKKGAQLAAKNICEVAREVFICKWHESTPEKFDLTNLIDTIPPEDPNRAAEQKKLIQEVLANAVPYKKPNILDYCVSSLWIRTQDVKIEWLLENLIPQGGITVFSGVGGSGKTYLCLQILDAIAEGREVFGLKTTKTPVFYIDHENPLAVMKDRLEKLACENIQHWSLWSETPPPKLDSDDWILYKSLPKGCLACFDSLRSIQDLDENSTKDMAFVMGRLKALREAGITPYILHHTPKSDPRTYRGAGPISDLADHTLNLFVGKQGTEGRIVEEGELAQPVFFGCSGKSRYEQHRILITFNPDGTGFALAEDPDNENLEGIRELILSRAPAYPIQADVFDLMYEKLHMTEKMGRKLLGKGEHLGLWRSWLEAPPSGGRLRRHYAAIQ